MRASAALWRRLMKMFLTFAWSKCLQDARKVRLHFPKGEEGNHDGASGWFGEGAGRWISPLVMCANMREIGLYEPTRTHCAYAESALAHRRRGWDVAKPSPQSKKRSHYLVARGCGKQLAVGGWQRRVSAVDETATYQTTKHESVIPRRRCFRRWRRSTGRSFPGAASWWNWSHRGCRS